MVPAELMVRAVTVPTDTVPQADYLLHELAARERFEIVVHRRHASSLGGSGTENKVSAHSRASAGRKTSVQRRRVRPIEPVGELMDEVGELTGS